jgi:hypothetical protein
MDEILKKLNPTSLPIRRDAIYGRQKESLDRVAMALNKTKPKADDPALIEIYKLGMNIKPMSRRVSIRGLGTTEKELDVWQYESLLKHIDSDGLERDLNRLVSSYGYKNMKDNDDKRDAIRGLINGYRQKAKAKWLRTEEGKKIKNMLVRRLKNKKAGLLNEDTEIPILKRLEGE